jgi:cyanophycin synthetase
MTLPFEDSRRLTGGNLFFAQPGAVLETTDVEADEELLTGWRARVAHARARLGWPDVLPDGARCHAGGASLALAAPADQLFTATEINEWALCATAWQHDPARWHDLEAAWLAEALAQAADESKLIPPVIDEHAAFERFAKLAAAERRPDVLDLIAAADAGDVAHVLDEQLLTLGAGAHARTWPLDALPASTAVPWAELSNVPIAAVTGSNGKTTTVRLIAACARAHGWRDGYCCTDGVFVANSLVEPGDYSGPAGTRRVLRDAGVQAGVLEMARGGLLRRGLAVDRADVAVVTNVSSDHFGEYGIDDLDGLADAKLVVGRLVARRGLLVLNADDEVLLRKAATLPDRLGVQPALGWFALDYDRPELARHRASHGAICGVRDGRLVLHWQDEEHELGPVRDMPLTVAGAATYNVANLAGAALAAVALGVPPATVREVYAHFGRDPADNAGRLMRYDLRGAHVLVDYAHNPDGLKGVLRVAQTLREPEGRLITLLGHAGNRRDEDIAELAHVAASFAPDLVVVKENEGHLRGRRPGEVPAILRGALLAAGMPESAIHMQPSELDAARFGLEAARPGDAVALLVHSTSARAAVLALLRDGTAHIRLG